MKQLKMLRFMDPIAPAPLDSNYYIRNICEKEPGEIDSWVEICKNQLIGENGTKDDYTTYITNKPIVNPAQDVFFVCEYGSGRPVATLTAHLDEFGDGWIHMVGSLPEIRGKKLGQAMLARGLEKLASDGVSRVWLTTDAWRLPAIRIYLKAGFKPMIGGSAEDIKWMEENWNQVFEKLHCADRICLYEKGEIRVGKES